MHTYCYMLSGLAVLTFCQVFSYEENNEPVSTENTEINQGKFIYNAVETAPFCNTVLISYGMRYCSLKKFNGLM